MVGIWGLEGFLYQIRLQRSWSAGSRFLGSSSTERHNDGVWIHTVSLRLRYGSYHCSGPLKQPRSDRHFGGVLRRVNQDDRGCESLRNWEHAKMLGHNCANMADA